MALPRRRRRLKASRPTSSHSPWNQRPWSSLSSALQTRRRGCATRSPCTHCGGRRTSISPPLLGQPAVPAAATDANLASQQGAAWSFGTPTATPQFGPKGETCNQSAAARARCCHRHFQRWLQLPTWQLPRRRRLAARRRRRRRRVGQPTRLSIPSHSARCCAPLQARPLAPTALRRR